MPNLNLYLSLAELEYILKRAREEGKKATELLREIVKQWISQQKLEEVRK